MTHEKIVIPAAGRKESGVLYTYFLDTSAEMHPTDDRPVVLLCPGGGYEMTSDREAEPIAVRFLAMGYHAAVLRYSVAPDRYPAALLELAGAVLYLKEHARQYHIDPGKVIVQGCSAGGHLAASYGVFWNRPFLAEALGVSSSLLKPAALLLCYPVITSGPKAHEGSFRSLLGDRYDELREEMSLEKQVTGDVPRTFLWHTASDDTVPVENSLLFFQALHEKQIPAELHIYPVGRHGLSLANYETSHPDGSAMQKECESWIDLAHTWLESL